MGSDRSTVPSVFIEALPLPFQAPGPLVRTGVPSGNSDDAGSVVRAECPTSGEGPSVPIGPDDGQAGAENIELGGSARPCGEAGRCGYFHPAVPATRRLASPHQDGRNDLAGMDRPMRGRSPVRHLQTPGARTLMRL